MDYETFAYVLGCTRTGCLTMLGCGRLCCPSHPSSSQHNQHSQHTGTVQHFLRLATAAQQPWSCVQPVKCEQSWYCIPAGIPWGCNTEDSMTCPPWNSAHTTRRHTCHRQSRTRQSCKHQQMQQRLMADSHHRPVQGCRRNAAWRMV